MYRVRRHVKGKRTKKLKEELEKMRAELEKTRMEQEQLSQKLAGMSQNADFYEARSSTVREEQPSGNETLLMTMSNMSLSSLNIPECLPTPGDTEINKRIYDHWKNILHASMNLLQVADEPTRFDLFRIKAGPLLLELFDGTTTQPGMPDEELRPYSNAIARLDAYFGSRAYILSQRSKLSNMVQRKGELNIEYVKRVAAASKLCNYKPDEVFEAISRTVTRGSTDSRVRTLAYRVLTDGGTLNELIDQVRIREVELDNEEDYRRLHQQKAATVAAVSQQYNNYGQRSRGQYGQSRGLPVNRARGGLTRGIMRNPRFERSCWRCLSTYHSPDNCFHSDKICRSCNRRGHIERACSSQVKGEPLKRRWTAEETEPPSKIALVQKTEQDPENNEVKEVNDE